MVTSNSGASVVDEADVRGRLATLGDSSCNSVKMDEVSDLKTWDDDVRCGSSDVEIDVNFLGACLVDDGDRSAEKDA